MRLQSSFPIPLFSVARQPTPGWRVFLRYIKMLPTLDECRASPVEAARRIIAGHKWIFAKTMPWVPHEYIRRSDCKDSQIFEWFVEYIREVGRLERYGKSIRSYLHLDNYKYWTMGAPVVETIIINRQATDKGYTNTSTPI